MWKLQKKPQKTEVVNAYIKMNDLKGKKKTNKQTNKQRNKETFLFFPRCYFIQLYFHWMVDLLDKKIPCNFYCSVFVLDEWEIYLKTK